MWSKSPCTITDAIAAHIPPADAPENTSIDTSCIGTGWPVCLAAYHASSASIRKSSTPAVYAPADTAPAMLIPIRKGGMGTLRVVVIFAEDAYHSGYRAVN